MEGLYTTQQTARVHQTPESIANEALRIANECIVAIAKTSVLIITEEPLLQIKNTS